MFNDLLHKKKATILITFIFILWDSENAVSRQQSIYIYIYCHGVNENTVPQFPSSSKGNLLTHTAHMCLGA